MASQDGLENLQKITPPTGLSVTDRDALFQYIFRQLASYSTNLESYAILESNLSQVSPTLKWQRQQAFTQDVRKWAQGLLEHTWAVLDEPGGGKCPHVEVGPEIRDIGHLPPEPAATRTLNTVLFLQVTTTKAYSARTRSFLWDFGAILDEQVIVATLQDPDKFIEDVKKHSEDSQQHHAQRNKTTRMVGMGLAAVAGGLLVGVTGGLAAPLVGGAFATVFGILGVGGPVVSLLATGLAGSSVICGTLFGAYGAHSTASMIERHTRDIHDFSILPVGAHSGPPTLAVRLCVSGWLGSPADVTQPWTVYGQRSNTFALRWEVEVLEKLAVAMSQLMKEKAVKYLQYEVLKRTLLGPLVMSLAPIALLNIGHIIDNPWSNAKALAIKAGAVLGDLLAKRVLGSRPISLTGYSLGSLVIFEALRHLAKLHPGHTGSLVQDVFLFGSPISTEPLQWASVRRVVAGRLVNGYSNDDYILAILSRVSQVNWNVAGLHPVEGVHGVENVLCPHVDAHLKWGALIGKSLQATRAPDLVDEEVEIQLNGLEETLVDAGYSTDPVHGSDQEIFPGPPPTIEGPEGSPNHPPKAVQTERELPRPSDWHPLA